MPETPDRQPTERRALYYPFHLCAEQTLHRLLKEYSSVHFRDYMALQVTKMSGTTAYMDRMGQLHPELVQSGRIVQGYSVSGPLDGDAIAAVDRDLADGSWRAGFHRALMEDRRFQRGLFDLSHGVRIGSTTVAGPAALLRLLEESWSLRPYTMQDLRRMSLGRLSLEQGYDYEYALALVKTAAALLYTLRLCGRHGLEAVTDSAAHFQLLERTCARDNLTVSNRCLAPEEP